MRSFLRSQAAAEDRRTDAFPPDHVVVVAGVVHRGHPTIDDPHDGMAVGSAAAQAEAAADDRQGDLCAAGLLILVFIGVQRRAPVELLGPGGTSAYFEFFGTKLLNHRRLDASSASTVCCRWG